jgi:hypothetical protein
MTLIVTPPTELQVELDMEVIVSEEDAVVYIKLSGFDTVQEADNYADYLTHNLPLILFHSEVIH